MPKRGQPMPEKERAKRRKNADEKRSVHVMLRLTEGEAAKLDERRAASGRKRTEQVVKDLFGRAEPTTVSMTSEQWQEGSVLTREIAYALNALTREVGRVGANLNQIAKRTNLAAAALRDDPRTRSVEAWEVLAGIAEHGPVVADAVREVEAFRARLGGLNAKLMDRLDRAGARW